MLFCRMRGRNIKRIMFHIRTGQGMQIFSSGNGVKPGKRQRLQRGDGVEKPV